MQGTLIGDADPVDDYCSAARPVEMTGKNVGDLLNARNMTWGWFQGGFRPTSRNPDGDAVCGAMHNNTPAHRRGRTMPHHEPFQYYPRTANPHHLPPTSVKAIGHGDQANHQYDIERFSGRSAGRESALGQLSQGALISERARRQFRPD